HQQHQDDGGDADDAPHGDQRRGPARVHRAEGFGQGRLHVQFGVGAHAGDDRGHRHVQDGHDEQGPEDADGDVPFGIAGLLGGGGDDVEADEGEEHHGGGGDDPPQAEGGGVQAEQDL